MPLSAFQRKRGHCDGQRKQLTVPAAGRSACKIEQRAGISCPLLILAFYLYVCESLLDICKNILDILYSDGEANQVGSDSRRNKLLIGELTVS